MLNVADEPPQLCLHFSINMGYDLPLHTDEKASEAGSYLRSKVWNAHSKEWNGHSKQPNVHSKVWNGKLIGFRWLFQRNESPFSVQSIQKSTKTSSSQRAERKQKSPRRMASSEAHNGFIDHFEQIAS